MTATVRPGDRVTATLDDTTGTTITADLAVTRVDHLGCGCTRLTADRPGPDTGSCRRVQLLTGCTTGGHDNDVTHPHTRKEGRRAVLRDRLDGPRA